MLSCLPEWAKSPLRSVQEYVLDILCYGTGRWCPVCRRPSRRFREFGNPQRKDARCAHCSALERHRFVWLYWEKKTNLFDGRAKKVLHVAPEKSLECRLKKCIGGGYLTADLFERAMVRMNVTDVPCPDESVDVIYCSHVLEHVQEDRKAMSEFHRVLKKDGWAMLLVPITAERTWEDRTIVDPRQRLRIFGHEGHVRRYGPDYLDSLHEAGFEVTVTRISDLIEEGEAIRMGLTSASGDIYYCTKRARHK
jgi:SAM-dependent methyltransferase